MIPEGWHELKLGNFVSLQRGYDLTAEERRPGNVPVAGSSGINGWHDTANVKGPGVTLGRSGASFGVANYYSVDFWAHNTVMFVTDFHGNDVLFAYHFLDYFNFDRYNSGGAQPSLNRNFIYPIRIAIPSLSEQRKIAEILSTWDEAIRLAQALIAGKQQHKKGLMQRLLTGQVRFPGFTERPWRTVHMRDVFVRVTRKNDVGNKNVLTASAQYGLVSQTDFFNRSVAGKDLARYYLLTRGEFAYNRSSAAGYEFGAIKRLDKYEKGLLSTLYICFGLKDQRQNSDFLVHYFESGGLDREIYGIAQEGARSHGLLNVSLSDFFNLRITLPSREEQDKIADVLNACDREIHLLQQKLAALQQQKKGLMQRLLTGELRVVLPVPGKGQTAPK